MTISKALYAKAKRAFGKNAFVREDKNAPTPAQRLAKAEKVKELRAEEARLTAEIKALDFKWTTLLEAGEFFRDVNGGPPSTEQFHLALNRARQHVNLQETRRLTEIDRRAVDTGFRRRWEAGFDENIILPMRHCVISADTKAELIQKLDEEIAKKAKPKKKESSIIA